MKRCVCLLLLWLCTGAPSWGAVARIRVLRLLLVNPQGTSLDQGARRLQSEVERFSQGRLRLQVYSDGQWQGKRLAELAILKAVHDGDVDMAIVTSSPLANFDPAFQVLDTPFLFDTYEQCDRVLDGPSGQRLLDSLPSHGLQGLAFWDTGFRVLALRKPWHGIDDLRGDRVRVMESPMYQTFMKLFGAIPVPAGIDKVEGLRKSGYIDAIDTSYPPFLEYRMFETNRYIVETQHSYAAKVVLVNDALFRALSPQEQGWLVRASQETRLAERRIFRAEEQQTRARCKALGVTITPLSPSDRRRMKSACRPMYDSLSHQLKEPWQQALLGGTP